MKAGDLVMIVPYHPMARTCKALVGQTATILSGPHKAPEGSSTPPDQHYVLDLSPCNARKGIHFGWWVKHLMPLDPDEAIKDEEHSDEEITS